MNSALYILGKQTFSTYHLLLALSVCQKVLLALLSVVVVLVQALVGPVGLLQQADGRHEEDMSTCDRVTVCSLNDYCTYFRIMSECNPTVSVVRPTIRRGRIQP